MNIIVFKQHFYKYISKAEYTMAFTTLLGSLTTTFLQGYSSYLSDRNNRITRLNETPLNHIYVNYISLNEFERITNKNNWKPVSERVKKEKQTQQTLETQKTFQYKKQELIKSINSWLINKTNKKKQNNSEIDAESLKQLALINQNDVYLNMIEENSTKNEYNMDKNSNEKQKYILPPMKKKIEKNNYFIVQEAGGYVRYNPIQTKLSHQKQNIKSSSQYAQNKIGKIGNKDISKDDSIFDSIAKIWRALIYKKEPQKYGEVIDSRYDQYGNRIQWYERLEVKDGHAIAENNSEKIKKKEKENKFFIPIIEINGNIQQIEQINNNMNKITDKKLTHEDLLLLSFIEYTIEDCWYQKYTKKYGKNKIKSDFIVEYDQNTAKIKRIALKNISKQINKQTKTDFLQNFQQIMYNCDFSNSQYLTQKNYPLWGKLQIKFT